MTLKVTARAVTRRALTPQGCGSGLALALPRLKPCQIVNVGRGKVLITCAGFEDRALAWLRSVVLHEGGTVVVLSYKPEDRRNKVGEVQRALRQRGYEVNEKTWLEYDRYDPGGFPERLRARLEEVKGTGVLVDVSGMSRLAILIVLDVCRELDLDVTLHYAEAREYAPVRDDYERAKSEGNIYQPSIQLYTGVHRVIRVARLSSVAMQGQPTAAIAFMSFNERLTQALLNAVYPSRLFLVNGRPPMLRWREEATAWIHDQLRREWPDDDNPVAPRRKSGVGLPRRVTSTLDYRETVRVFLDLYWTLASDYRVLSAPTGSKMQTIGCYIVKALHPDIHIEYPTARGFLDLYSTGVGRRWLVRFGHLGKKLEELRWLERRLHIEIGGGPWDEG